MDKIALLNVEVIKICLGFVSSYCVIGEGTQGTYKTEFTFDLVTTLSLRFVPVTQFSLSSY